MNVGDGVDVALNQIGDGQLGRVDSNAAGGKVDLGIALHQGDCAQGFRGSGLGAATEEDSAAAQVDWRGIGNAVRQVHPTVIAGSVQDIQGAILEIDGRGARQATKIGQFNGAASHKRAARVGIVLIEALDVSVGVVGHHERDGSTDDAAPVCVCLAGDERRRATGAGYHTAGAEDCVVIWAAEVTSNLDCTIQVERSTGTDGELLVRASGLSRKESSVTSREFYGAPVDGEVICPRVRELAGVKVYGAAKADGDVVAAGEWRVDIQRCPGGHIQADFRATCGDLHTAIDAEITALNQNIAGRERQRLVTGGAERDTGTVAGEAVQRAGYREARRGSKAHVVGVGRACNIRGCIVTRVSRDAGCSGAGGEVVGGGAARGVKYDGSLDDPIRECRHRRGDELVRSRTEGCARAVRISLEQQGCTARGTSETGNSHRGIVTRIDTNHVITPARRQRAEAFR